MVADTVAWGGCWETLKGHPGLTRWIADHGAGGADRGLVAVALGMDESLQARVPESYRDWAVCNELLAAVPSLAYPFMVRAKRAGDVWRVLAEHWQIINNKKHMEGHIAARTFFDRLVKNAEHM